MKQIVKYSIFQNPGFYLDTLYMDTKSDGNNQRQMQSLPYLTYLVKIDSRNKENYVRAQNGSWT